MQKHYVEKVRNYAGGSFGGAKSSFYATYAMSKPSIQRRW
jgi:hypothetical protein